MKKLFAIAGVSMVIVFASASVTSGLLDTPQARGHAIDGIKTALGMPYGDELITARVGVHTEPLTCTEMELSLVPSLVRQMTLAQPQLLQAPQPTQAPQAPQAPEPPQPPQAPQALAKTTKFSNVLQDMSQSHDACS